MLLFMLNILCFREGYKVKKNNVEQNEIRPAEYFSQSFDYGWKIRQMENAQKWEIILDGLSLYT